MHFSEIILNKLIRFAARTITDSKPVSAQKMQRRQP